MDEVAPLTLANIPLDVQIGICLFLHPSDILALRKVCQHQKFSLLKTLKYYIIKTCKVLQATTWRRVVWVAALHRVCLDNTLFLPSFPISDMSDLELENAAMGPHRWIELCGAFERQHPNDPGAVLWPRTIRIINAIEIDYFATDLFIVPGGRYLVTSSHISISVLDLGYTSSVDCKVIASVGLEGGDYGCNTCLVQATPDGMGLIIVWSNS